MTTTDTDDRTANALRRDAANKLRWAEVLMRAGEPELAAEIEVEGRIARRKFNDLFERNAA